MDAREHQVRRRTADVDADGGEFDIVQAPHGVGERLLLVFAQMDVRLEIVMHRMRHSHAGGRGEGA
jgi:hypothetical protein